MIVLLTSEAGLQMFCKPFQCCQMPNFINNERFLEELRDELLDQICYEKNNDLYKFHQVYSFTVLLAIVSSMW